MLKLDNNLLEELGLGSLPDAQKRQMLQQIYETLELRVGTQLANQMTNQQLEEFERFIDSGGNADQAQALQWLEANLPNYKEVVQQTFEALKAEVRQYAPQLLAAAPQAPQEAQVVYQPPVAPPQAPPQQPYGQQQSSPQPPTYGNNPQQSYQPVDNSQFAQPQSIPQAPPQPPVDQSGYRQPSSSAIPQAPPVAPPQQDYGQAVSSGQPAYQPSQSGNDFGATTAPQSGFTAAQPPISSDGTSVQDQAQAVPPTQPPYVPPQPPAQPTWPPQPPVQGQ